MSFINEVLFTYDVETETKDSIVYGESEEAYIVRYKVCLCLMHDKG